MAYDEKLALRIRPLFSRRKNIIEKKMFGGVCFLLNGNMLVGIHKDNLIVRIGNEAFPTLIKKSHAGPFDITGRPMSGWISVAPAGLKRADQLKSWLEAALKFVKTLPKK